MTDLETNQLRIIDRLDSIIKILSEMKEQERGYWETWRVSKEYQRRNDNK